jgi:hypothetical protein
MKARDLLAGPSALLVALAFLLVLPADAQRGGQRGGPPASANPPRANQGHLPAPPMSRPNRSEPRQTEHLPTGHANDTPHVNHDQWFGHESPNDPRFHLDHPFPQGRFEHVGPAYRYAVARFDKDHHRFWLTGGFFFDVAEWEWPLCVDWCWTCGDDFAIYEDPDHPGWYLLYNVHTGVYVHCQYLGM